MASIVQYNPEDTVVASRVTLYLTRANTPDYMNQPHTLINTPLSSVSDIPQAYWKVVDDAVVEMSPEEKLAIDEECKAKTIREQLYKINVYDLSYRLESETWYDTTSQDNAYSGKSLETSYTYDGNSLISKTEKTYYYDGSLSSTVIHEFYKDNGKIIEKVREA